MRRPYDATTYIARRAGVPCGPRPREVQHEPAPAPKPGPRSRCVHGRDENWLDWCEAEGTYRVPEECAPRYVSHSARAWVLNARWCPEHAPAYSVPVDS